MKIWGAPLGFPLFLFRSFVPTVKFAKNVNGMHQNCVGAFM